jgi:hypothetical protein
LQGGSELSFNSASQYGGALPADEMCSITVRDALLLNNTSAYGGATALKNSAHLLVEAGAVYRDNYGEYGGCIAAQVRGAPRNHLHLCARQRVTYALAEQIGADPVYGISWSEMVGAAACRVSVYTVLEHKARLQLRRLD